MARIHRCVHLPRLKRRCLCTTSALVAAPERSLLPGSRVLFFGEGNFSFAAAFSKAHTNVSIVASSLEDEADAVHIWGAGPSLRELRQLSNCTVLHGVDATKLGSSPLRGEHASFDVICWLFPHAGKKGRVQLNRELVAAGCESVATHGLLRKAGCLEIALAAGQGGTAADGADRRAFGDSWQIVLAAAEGGLLVTSAEPFQEQQWHEFGYRSSGCYRGLGMGTYDQAFRTTGALVHSLQPQGDGVSTPFPLEIEHCSSFWCDDHPSFTTALLGSDSAASMALAADVLALGSVLTDGALQRVEPVNCWRRPSDGRVSICLRFAYSHSRRAHTLRTAHELHLALRSALPLHLRCLECRFNSEAAADGLPNAR